MSIFRIWSDDFDHRRQRAVVIVVERENGEELLGSMTFSVLSESQYIGQEGATIPGRMPHLGSGVGGNEFLQAVLDHAWSLGMRPVGFLDTPNQIAAMRDHMHDLRALIFRGDVKPKE